MQQTNEISKNQNFLPQGWRLARFDEFLKRVERKCIIDDSAIYNCVGVRWYGMGAFIREQLLGMNIARKQQWIVNSGDVIYNKLFAWKGSFAIADTFVNGCIVSDKFPTYELNTDLVEPKFLSFYFQAPQIAQKAQDLSKGAAAISKLTLNPPQFWDLTIPLPSLLEQQQIVARIEELTAKVKEAKELRHGANKANQTLSQTAISQALEEVPIDGTLEQILLEKPRNGWSARCDNADSGIPVLSLGAVTGFSYRSSEFKRTSEATSTDAHYWLQPGDLLITRSNSPELVGHAAIYNGFPHPCIYPDLMMKLLIDEEKADKRFVHGWLRSTPVREYIARSAKGTSPTMKKISQGTVMNIPFPISLSITQQQRVLAHLEIVQNKLSLLSQLQIETGKEIDALLPSILDKAFKGEL